MEDQPRLFSAKPPMTAEELRDRLTRLDMAATDVAVNRAADRILPPPDAPAR